MTNDTSAIETAIRDAVEKGGYDRLKMKVVWHDWIGDNGIENEPVNGILLDPSFWQALGKARGWRESANGMAAHKILGTYGTEWRLQWHLFIDHLADGKDAESFFASLESRPSTD
jgi:hypothetical protein